MTEENNKGKTANQILAATLKVNTNIETAVIDLLKSACEKKLFDSLLLPLKVPAGDSYAWVLFQDTELLQKASPFPPIISVQGAKAISSITKPGNPNMKIATVMRPCEIRAAIELAKLKQVDLANLFIITMDCPGAMSFQDYIKEPDKTESEFKKIINDWESDSVRTICQMCDAFTCGQEQSFQSDLHLAIIGMENNNLPIVPNTAKGKKFLEAMGLAQDFSLKNWQNKVKELIAKRRNKRKQIQEELKPSVTGLNALCETFTKCINCKVCRSVCPICFCRQCYFDSEKLKFTPDDYLMRAEDKGSMKFLPDTLLFQIGRMMHMTLSCVGCGACEDACPMDIKVAQIFSVVADRIQELFEYVPGRNLDEPLPLTVFKEEEFKEIET